MPKYIITHIDNTIYIGGDSVFDSKWKSIPDKHIASLEYFFCENESIILRNFEAYNHIVEMTKAVQGPKGTNMEATLQNVYIMGLMGNKVTSYRISMNGKKSENRYLIGDLTKRIFDKGKEFRGQPTFGWKKGI